MTQWLISLEYKVTLNDGEKSKQRKYARVGTSFANLNRKGDERQSD